MSVKRQRVSASDSRRVRLSDVAREASVSTATVSRALNAPDRIAPQVRKRIFDTIDRLGYVPNGAARALAMQKSRTFGAIVPTIGNSIFARSITAFQERLEKDHYTLLLATTEYRMETEFAKAPAFVERGVEGIMLVGETHDPALYQLLHARRIPYINTLIYRENAPHPCCGFDYEASTSRWVERLIALGHRRFAVLTGYLERNDRIALRLRAVLETAARHGISIPADAIVESHYSTKAARYGAERLLLRANRPTALICANDVLAFGAMTACRNLGIEIPTDISIVVHGDHDIASQLSPSLSTKVTWLQPKLEEKAEH